MKWNFVNNEICVAHIRPGMWLIRPRNVAYDYTRFKRAEVKQVAEVKSNSTFTFYNVRWEGDETFQNYHPHQIFVQVELVGIFP